MFADILTSKGKADSWITGGKIRPAQIMPRETDLKISHVWPRDWRNHVLQKAEDAEGLWGKVSDRNKGDLGLQAESQLKAS